MVAFYAALLAPLSLALTAYVVRADAATFPRTPNPASANYLLGDLSLLRVRQQYNPGCPVSHPVQCERWPNACTQFGKTCCDLSQGTTSCDAHEYCFMHKGQVKCCAVGDTCDDEDDVSSTTRIATQTVVVTAGAGDQAPPVVTTTVGGGANPAGGPAASGGGSAAAPPGGAASPAPKPAGAEPVQGSLGVAAVAIAVGLVSGTLL